jgi:hypothetical protein
VPSPQSSSTPALPDFGTGLDGFTTQAIGTSYASVLSVTVAKSGLYIVQGQVSASGQFNGTVGTNTTAIATLCQNGTPICSAQVLLSPQQNANTLFYGSCALSAVVGTGANDVFSIQVKFANGSSSGWTSANVLGNSLGNVGTFLSYVQLG